MLETACGDRELQGLLRVIVGVQAVDQAGGETVAAADAVDDVRDLVAARQPERLGVAQARGPAVAVGAVGLAQRDRDHAHVGVLRQHLRAQGLVAGRIELPGLHIDTGGNAQRFLAILFVGDADVDVLHQFRHHLRRRFAVLPQLAAEVEVAGYGDAGLPGRDNGFKAQLGRGGAECRGDAGDVEPSGAAKNGRPVEVAGLCIADG